jgi:hypothetical protein
MVLEAVTQRLRQCECGVRFLTTETVTRKLVVPPSTAGQPPANPPATHGQPPGNNSAQPSSSGLDLTSLSQPDPERAREEQTVFRFPVSGRNAPVWALGQERHEEFGRAFPGVDRFAEYEKISAWSNANPKRRKTPRGMPAFLFRWLEKAQNEAARAPAPRLVESFAERDARIKRETEQRKSRERAEAMRVQRELDEQLRKAGAG